MRNTLTVSAWRGLALCGVLASCGPDGAGKGPPADDVAWIIDHFARGADCAEEHITLCLAGHYHEYDFRADGTVQAYEVTCGIRQPADPAHLARWQATSEYGVVDIFPTEGASVLEFPVGLLEHGTATLTDDYQVVELRFAAEDPNGVDIDRGNFKYEITDCAAYASYLDDPPICPSPGEGP